VVKLCALITSALEEDKERTLGIHWIGYGGHVGKEGHQAHSSHFTELSMCTGSLICT
jgi:hypothetical protein